MANNYFQGTVLPFLPLTQAHKDLLNWDASDCVLDVDGEWLESEENRTPEDIARSDLDRLALSLGLTEEYRMQGCPEYELGSPVYNLFGGDGLYYLYLEHGLGEEASTVLQHILKDMDKEEYPYLIVEGAYTCDKLRAGEFGGWACVIFRDRIEWGGTSSWIESVTDSPIDKMLLEKASHWDDVPDFPVKDWQYEVSNEDTRLGYREWCNQQQELKNEGADDDLDG